MPHKRVKRTKNRAVAVLIEEGKVALIERHRAGKVYHVFPGGGVEDGEWPTEAVVREVEEELGLVVKIKKLVAEVLYSEKPQYFFLVERVGGQFGTGAGEEMANTSDSETGSYKPVWVPIVDLPQMIVYPQSIVALIGQAVKNSWPEEVQRFHETLRK